MWHWRLKYWLLKIQLCIHWNKRRFKIENNYVQLWYYCNILLFLLWYKVHIYTSKMNCHVWWKYLHILNRPVYLGSNTSWNLETAQYFLSCGMEIKIVWLQLAHLIESMSHLVVFKHFLSQVYVQLMSSSSSVSLHKQDFKVWNQNCS